MAYNKLICRALLLSMITLLVQSAQFPAVPSSLQSSTEEPTVKIQCLSNYMLITIKDAPTNDASTMFSGMIYPKGLSKNSTCRTEYRNHDSVLKYKLPLRSCNTMPQETDDGEIEFFNTIVLQPHLKLVTDLGRGYHVRCRYKSNNAIVPMKVAIAESLTSDENVDRRNHGRALDFDLSNSINTPMPECHMQIISKDIVAKNVKIGDPLTINIFIEKQNVYGLHVTDCTVRDGLGWGEQTLLNSNGCPLDGEIMGPFQYNADRSKASVSFLAHKFPYTASVYYQCKVQLCALANPECQQAPNCLSNRIKRDADKTEYDGQPATIEVYSGLYVNENAEVIDNDDDSVFAEKTHENALCISQHTFAVTIAVAGLILMLAVVVAVLCIMIRRQHKNVSNSGSSIYSGPYSNTALSHSS